MRQRFNDHEAPMAARDDEARPKLGRIRDRKGRKTVSYITRVLRTAEKTIGPPGRTRRPRFTGARIGHGRAQGSIAALRRSGGGRRRVIVKTRVVRLKGSDLSAARSHLRYVQRDGVTREGEPGRLYAAAIDEADGNAFIPRSAGDRHQFRFIVSAEDGAELGDLKPFIRDLMRQMEHDPRPGSTGSPPTISIPGIRTPISSCAARTSDVKTSSSPATTSPTACAGGQATW
jgi:hypothetical protein